MQIDKRIFQYPQSFVVATKDLPVFSQVYASSVANARRLVLRACHQCERQLKIKAMRSLYLRRGAGRSEFVAGASDLDFFLVLYSLPAYDEMDFLKLFWRKYQKLKKLFPFLGEALMGDENELENWFASKTVRAYESRFSWQCIWGENVFETMPAPVRPCLRDCYAEGLKYFWALLHPTLKFSVEKIEHNLPPYLIGSLHLRNGFKAALDLFRIHRALCVLHEQQDEVWQASRVRLLSLLPKEIYSELNAYSALLTLDQPLFRSNRTGQLDSAAAFFEQLCYTSLRCLHDIASRLEESEQESMAVAQVQYHGKKAGIDPYTQSVRELFAERVLIRHKSTIEKIVISEMNAQMYFLFTEQAGNLNIKAQKEPTTPLEPARVAQIPDRETFRQIIHDIRRACSSFKEFSIAMPLTKTMYKQLEKTSLLDSPFHSCYSHRDVYVDEKNSVHSSTSNIPEVQISADTVNKTVAELSFSLRFLPPNDFSYILDKIIVLLLSLRLMQESGVVMTDFDAILARFSEKYPRRIDHLKEKLGKYMHLRSDAESETWSQFEKVIDILAQKEPLRAQLIRDKVARAKRESERNESLRRPFTDLWIELYPFLRMEINVVKDLVFTKRPDLIL